MSIMPFLIRLRSKNILRRKSIVRNRIKTHGFERRGEFYNMVFDEICYSDGGWQVIELEWQCGYSYRDTVDCQERGKQEI